MASAKVLWQGVFDLPKNTLTDESVQQIVTAVAEALSPPLPEAVSELHEVPPPSESSEENSNPNKEIASAEESEESPKETANVEGSAEENNQSIADAKTGEENKTEEATEETGNTEETTESIADAKAGEEDKTEETTEETGNTEETTEASALATSEGGEFLQAAPVATARRPLYFSAGVGGIYRNAGLSSSATSKSVEYTTVGMVPGLILRGEAYLFDYLPLNTPALQNVALNMEATLFSVDSEEFGSSKSSDMSGEYNLEFMLHHAMAEGENAPTLQAGLGYSHFRLPLQDASFPGTKYHSAHLAVAGEYPLPTPLPTGHRLTALAGLGYRFKVFRSGKLKRLGELDAASGLNGQLGVRTRHKQFILTALWGYDRYQSSYTGASRLPRPTQYTDASLTDAMHHLQFLVGYYYDVP
ncbi:MAG: hypothetical protein VX699_05410 [Myxococcota bacterium]|nr:hypothetical protein [Myxococcota bacterium]